MKTRGIQALGAALVVCALCAIGLPAAAAGAQGHPGPSPASSAILFYQRYLSDLRYGHCRFTPSCSEYARQSIGTYGLLRGSALAADRLVRCNSSARGFYLRDANGNLVDPVAGEVLGVGAPRIPTTLLPFIGALYTLPFPRADDVEEDRGEPGRREGTAPAAAVKKASECAAFGDFLAAQGDCERAGTEYLRAAFIASSDSSQVAGLTRWSRLKTAACYYRNRQWAEATGDFEDIVRAGSATVDERRLAGTMAAAALFNEGKYQTCRRRIDKWCLLVPTLGTSPGDSTDSSLGGIDRREVARSAYVVSALCDMGRGRWDDASRTLEEIARAGRPSSSTSLTATEVLSSIARRGPSLPKRNATLAPVLSALVPGSGQVYAGRAGDGLRHFILDGLLICGVSRLIRDDEYWAAYLVAGIALPFYAGNVMGAHAAAEDFNQRKAAAFLNAELRRLESP